MKVCKHCRKENNIENAIFCPYCGKKYEVPKIAKTPFIEVIKIMTDEEFDREFSEIKKMDSVSARKALLEPRAYFVYGIKCKSATISKVTSPPIRREFNYRVSLTELKKLLINPIYNGVFHEFIEAVATEYTLPKSYSADDIGEWLWRTKAECEDAIQNCIDENKEKEK